MVKRERQFSAVLQKFKAQIWKRWWKSVLINQKILSQSWTWVKRQKFFEEKWEILETVDCVLGVRFDVHRDRTTEVYSQIPVTDKFLYALFLGTRMSMFRKSELCESFLQVKQHEEGIYKDIGDGSYLKYALQIQLHFDEFETADPLGSMKGIHTLGCNYFILRNLPPKCYSVTTIFMLWHSVTHNRRNIDLMKHKSLSLMAEGLTERVPFSDSLVLGSIR